MSQLNAAASGEFEDGSGERIEFVSEQSPDDPSVLLVSLRGSGEPPEPKGVPEKQLEDLLPKSTVGKLDAGKCCSICICDLEMGETIRKLACGHCFHNEFFDRWFARSVMCLTLINN